MILQLHPSVAILAQIPSGFMLRFLFMSWAAWLVTCRSSFRQVEHAVPFKANNQTNHRLNLRVVRNDVVDLVAELAEDLPRGAFDPQQEYTVLALMQVRPAFAYDHLRI